MSEPRFIFDADEQNFQQGVIDNSHQLPVLVDFWAEWCQPCKQLIPILEKLAKEMQGQFLLAKVNSETQQALSQQFQVRSIPTVFIFKNGEIVDQFNGLIPEQQIRDYIQRHITTEGDRIRNQAVQQIQSGDFEGGHKLLLEAEQLEPENANIQIDLAHIEANNQAYQEAQQRLEKLRGDNRQRPEVISLLSKIELALATEGAASVEELLLQVETTPDNSTARYQLAMQLIQQENFEPALQHLLTLMQRDRDFQDGVAQKRMLDIFSLLGDEHPLVGSYRRKMFSALY